MGPELRQLRVTRAAQKANLAQQGLSSAIQRLEAIVSASGWSSATPTESPSPPPALAVMHRAGTDTTTLRAVARTAVSAIPAHAGST